MSDARADQIKSVIDENRNNNELTFLIKFWVGIVDLERYIPAPPILQTTSEDLMTDTQREAGRQ